MSRSPSALRSTVKAVSPDERPLKQILTSWDRLQRLLQGAPSTSPDTISDGISETASTRMSAACACSFPAGASSTPDILVGGDGIRSSVRAQMAPDVQPVYAGYYIWRGAPNEADLAAETLSSDLSSVHVLPARASAGDLPIPLPASTTTCGRASVASIFIWYRVADAAKLREMNVDENGVQHEHSVPPPLIRKDLIAEHVQGRA